MNRAAAYARAVTGVADLARELGVDNAEELIFRASGLQVRTRHGAVKAATKAVELGRELLDGEEAS